MVGVSDFSLLFRSPIFQKKDSPDGSKVCALSENSEQFHKTLVNSASFRETSY